MLINKLIWRNLRKLRDSISSKLKQIFDSSRFFKHCFFAIIDNVCTIYSQKNTKR